MENAKTQATATAPKKAPKRKHTDSDLPLQPITTTFPHGAALKQYVKGHALVAKASQMMASGQKLIMDSLMSLNVLEQGKDASVPVTDLFDIKQLSVFEKAQVQQQLNGESSDALSKNGKKKRRKTVREPHAKKINGYLVFCEERRKGLVSEGKSPGGKEFMTEMGAMWNKLPAEEKQEFNDRAKVINQEELVKFHKEQAEKAASTEPSSDSSATPAPETAKSAEKPAVVPATPATVVVEKPAEKPAVPETAPQATEEEKRKKKHRRDKKKHKKEAKEQVKSE